MCICLTWFRFNALAINIAPSSAIWLFHRSSWTSVYIKKFTKYSRNVSIRSLTLFCTNALAKCSDPKAPILLFTSDKWVSVYINIVQYIHAKQKQPSHSPGSFSKPQLRIQLLRSEYHSTASIAEWMSKIKNKSYLQTV